MVRFVRKSASAGYFLDKKALFEAQKKSARIGLRMTLVDLELPKWDEIQKRDRLLGTSVTGWQDAMSLIGYTKEEEMKLMKEMKKIAREEADRYAEELQLPNKPLLVSTVKPEGTISQVFGSEETETHAGGTPSSGLHYSHSPFYIRRIRINSTDPLVKVAQELNWTINPEVGQTWENARTLVIDFPVKSGASRTKDDVLALEQLGNYFSFQKNYTEHNSSNTIHIRDHEWTEVEQNIWDNWENFMAVSFLSYDNNSYALAPYEECNEADYLALRNKMSKFDSDLLEKYEERETEKDLENMEACSSGNCPIF